MFKYKGNNLKIKKAVAEANSEDVTMLLINDICDADQFDMTDATNEHIAISIQKFLIENDIFINVYYPKWKWSKAIGYFSINNPTTININGYKLNRSIASFVGNFYHELTHMVSANDNIYSYDHGSNDPTGKENTAPYAIGDIAYWLAGEEHRTETPEYKTYIPWYKRLLNFIWRV
jgi:hypothetical protein